MTPDSSDGFPQLGPLVVAFRGNSIALPCTKPSSRCRRPLWVHNSRCCCAVKAMSYNEYGGWWMRMNSGLAAMMLQWGVWKGLLLPAVTFAWCPMFDAALVGWKGSAV